MHDVVATQVHTGRQARRQSFLLNWLRTASPSLVECGLAISSAVLLTFSFPNFDLAPLAWIALVPLLLLIVRRPKVWPAFFASWLFGSIFFYVTCYWLTYSMINFGSIPAPLAFVMLIPGALVMGVFAGVFGMVQARLVNRWGAVSLLFAPLIWVSLEWVRLQCTGQLWNAIGYSQAYHPALIGSAKWGGVYAVGALIVATNAGVSLAIAGRNKQARLAAAAALICVAAVVLASRGSTSTAVSVVDGEGVEVVAIQPNVPMNLVKSVDDMRTLTDFHFTTTENALRTLSSNGRSILVIWPESPMYFAYGRDTELRERLASFARAHRISLLFNSQEPAPNDGVYNSAMLINEDGSLVSQYDKIRLLPFGEYVPLPHWFPGAGLITAIVGDFTPGTHYRQMLVGNVRAGVFICVESAYPHIAREYTRAGADVLINISNDGYLGPTAVMRQHLANAVFRAVENQRPVVRVTNSGITAYITADGNVRDATGSFRSDIRVWSIGRKARPTSFYAAQGDLFVGSCLLLSFFAVAVSFRWRSVRH